MAVQTTHRGSPVPQTSGIAVAPIPGVMDAHFARAQVNQFAHRWDREPHAVDHAQRAFLNLAHDIAASVQRGEITREMGDELLALMLGWHVEQVLSTHFADHLNRNWRSYWRAAGVVSHAR